MVHYRTIPSSQKNCPILEVVTARKDCEAASDQLGIKFGGSSSRNDKPAGCHKLNANFFFNTIIDPALTMPEKFLYHVEAVCGRLGMC